MDRGPGGGGGFAVQVDSVSEAARMLATLGEELGGDVDRVRDQAVLAFGAIPPSDLQDAYGYFWGRWSQALEDAMTAVTDSGQVTGQAAGGYNDTEQSNAGGFGSRRFE